MFNPKLFYKYDLQNIIHYFMCHIVIISTNIKSYSHLRWFASQSIFDAKLLIYLLYKYVSKMPRFSHRRREDDFLG